MLFWQMQNSFSKSNLPILLRCMHPACIDCIIEIKENQKGEKWITITCKECGEEEDLKWITITNIMILSHNFNKFKILFQILSWMVRQLSAWITTMSQSLLIAKNAYAIFASFAKWRILITPKTIFKVHLSKFFSRGSMNKLKILIKEKK